ncbi:MAG: ribosome silencing factor [bacterium]|nr:ribosome silencing factor [bacterium]
MEDLKAIKILTRTLSAKKAEDIVVLDVRGKSSITDFFVIATGNSYVHVNALLNYVKQDMQDAGIPLLHREGTAKDSHWAVIDFGFVILHVFTDDLRTEYNIESIWGDAKKIEF